MPIAVCPECEEDVHVDAEADQGNLITCEACETTLEVVGLDPIELDPYVKDDLDDDDDFDLYDDDAEELD